MPGGPCQGSARISPRVFNAACAWSRYKPRAGRPGKFAPTACAAPVWRPSICTTRSAVSAAHSRPPGRRPNTAGTIVAGRSKGCASPWTCLRPARAIGMILAPARSTASSKQPPADRRSRWPCSRSTWRCWSLPARRPTATATECPAIATRTTMATGIAIGKNSILASPAASPAGWGALPRQQPKGTVDVLVPVPKSSLWPVSRPMHWPRPKVSRVQKCS